MSNESGALDDTLGELLPGGKLFTRYAPGIFERGFRLFFGPKIYLYGHNRAGKTSLVRYLLTSTSTDPNVPSQRTETEITNRALAFKLHGRDDVVVHVRALRDRPGQVDGNMHAIRFCQELPHTAILMLDSQFPYKGEAVNSIDGYLEAFWSEVKLRAHVVPPQVHRVWMVANKADRMSEFKHRALLKKIETDARRYTKGVISPAKLRVRGCSLIDEKNGKIYVTH